jgi:hypothetical protein
MNSTKDNERQHNHVYQYKYIHVKNMNRHHHHRNKDTSNPNWSNTFYFRGLNGWFYELKGQYVSQICAQNNESRDMFPQRPQKAQINYKYVKNISNYLRVWAQELKNHYNPILFKVVMM